MFVKLGAVLISCVLSEDEVDESSLLSLKSVVKHQTTGPKYLTSDNGDTSKAVWQCPKGSSHLTTKAECHTACLAVGGTVKYNFQDKTDWRWPNGCYQRTGSSASAQQGLCIWNVHDQSKEPHKQYDGTKSICVEDPPTDQSIEVTGVTSTIKHASSRGNFYIKFAGDATEYSLYTGGSDFGSGATNTWPLSVKPEADLTKPTIYLREHNDAWIPKSLSIKKDGQEVWNAGKISVVIDGNCETDAWYWNRFNLFCSRSLTWPFAGVQVQVKTSTGSTWAASNSGFYLTFAGDSKIYDLDTEKHNDFEKGNTDTYSFHVSGSADLTKPVTLAIHGRDGWLPEFIKMNGQVLQPVGHKFPVWVDGDCPSSGTQRTTRRRKSKRYPCKKQWQLA